MDRSTCFMGRSDKTPPPKHSCVGPKGTSAHRESARSARWPVHPCCTLNWHNEYVTWQIIIVTFSEFWQGFFSIPHWEFSPEPFGWASNTLIIIIIIIQCIYWALFNTHKALHIVSMCVCVCVCVCVGRDMTPHPLPVCSTHLGDNMAANMRQNAHHTLALTVESEEWNDPIRDRGDD